MPHPKVLLARRFVKFHENVQKSPKVNVRFLSELSAGNKLNVYEKNLWNISKLCQGNLSSKTVQKLFKYAPVPEQVQWKLT